MQCIATHLVSNGEKRIYTGVALACGVYVSAKDAEDDVLNLPVKKKRERKKEKRFHHFYHFYSKVTGQFIWFISPYGTWEESFGEQSLNQVHL